MSYILLVVTILIMFWILSLEDNQPQGVVKVKNRYHTNYMIKEQIPYNENEQLHGIYRYWNNNGFLELKAIFKNGSLNGICEKFDRQGRLIKKITYKNGNKIREKAIKVA